MPMLRRLSGTEMRRAASKKICSPTRTVPRSGCSRPAMQRKVVVLPQPLGPSSVKNVPGASVKDASRTPPAMPSPGLANTFVRSATSMRGVIMLCPICPELSKFRSNVARMSAAKSGDACPVYRCAHAGYTVARRCCDRLNGRPQDGETHADPESIAAQDLSRPSRARRVGLSIQPAGGPRRVLSARAVPVHRQRPARVARQHRRRHGLRHHHRASDGGRAVQRRAHRLRRRVPPDEPRRRDCARGGEDRHARALARASSGRRRAALSGVRAGGRAMNGLKRGGAAIVGVAESDLGQVADGFSPIDLMAQGVGRALADCGLALRDVDGLFAATAQSRLSVLALAEYLGIDPPCIGSTIVGGSSFEYHVAHAAAAIALGMCNVAVIAYGSTQRSIGRRQASMREINPYETPFKPFMPSSAYALAASRHMHEFGTTREQLAAVAVAAREWALLNPVAWEKKPLTIPQVLSARMISYPFTVRDICLVTDGGGAVIMTTAERARTLKKPPIFVLGCGQAITHANISSMPDLTVTGALAAGQVAYKMAKLGPPDVDAVELYDAFTINTILFLEDLGFCKKGEGGSAPRADSQSTPTVAACLTATPGCTDSSC